MKDLLEDPVTRGLSTDRRYLFVIDGAKALRAGIARVFGQRAEVQRCQLHKRRNVKEYLPKNAQGDYGRRIRNAYAMSGYAEAKAELGKIFQQLERVTPSAARSLEEGLEETLTVHRLGVGELLRRSLATTHPIESCLSTIIDREKHSVVTTWGTAMSFANYPMALDEPDHRVFVVTRFPARLLVFDSETGKVVQKLPAVGDCDDVFFDSTHKRIYAPGGEGAISVFEQKDSDHYTEVARILTIKGARTSFYSAGFGRLYLAARRQGTTPFRSRSITIEVAGRRIWRAQ